MVKWKFQIPKSQIPKKSQITNYKLQKATLRVVTWASRPCHSDRRDCVASHGLAARATQSGGCAVSRLGSLRYGGRACFWFVLGFGVWDLEFIWDLEFVIWDLPRSAHYAPSALRSASISVRRRPTSASSAARRWSFGGIAFFISSRLFSFLSRISGR